MGIVAPLAVLSDMHQNLFGYFKQRFAQVTNPPIDAIREKVVTSTTVYIGEDGNLLEEKAENCKMLKVNNPILTETDLLKIKNMKKMDSRLRRFRPSITRIRALKRQLIICLLKLTELSVKEPTF